MDSPKYNIVFSYQGAFGPPTIGHYKSMEAFANAMPTDKKVLMLFMPTGGGSKLHLEPTRATRKVVLDKFCEMLKKSFPHIDFETSEIEYRIFDEKKSTATIHTINELKSLYPNSSIYLGMGLDNAYQLPYWQDIDKYVKNDENDENVEKIYVVNRTPTPEELEKTRIFDINGSQLRFDVSVPWINSTFLQCFLGKGNPTTIGKGEKDKLIENLTCSNATSEDFATSAAECEKYKFFMDLPEIVIVENKIPATSSSMLRYYIGQYLQHIEKIRKLMSGVDESLIQGTIKNYEDVFEGKYPEDKGYDKEYASIVFSGGKRKTRNRRNTKRKTRKNRKKYKK